MITAKNSRMTAYVSLIAPMIVLTLLLYPFIINQHRSSGISFAQSINTATANPTTTVLSEEGQEGNESLGQYTPGYLCISTNSTNYSNGNWLNVCTNTYKFQTCQGNPQSGCPSADGYPDEDCGWPVGKMGVMCFTYGANPPFGVQGENTNTCDGINEGISDTC